MCTKIFVWNFAVFQSISSINFYFENKKKMLSYLHKILCVILKTKLYNMVLLQNIEFWYIKFFFDNCLKKLFK